jgi:hypothetical protein
MVVSQSQLQNGFCEFVTQIKFVSETRMIAVAVGYNRSLHRLPGINIKISRFAIKAFIRKRNKLGHELKDYKLPASFYGLII